MFLSQLIRRRCYNGGNQHHFWERTIEVETSLTEEILSNTDAIETLAKIDQGVSKFIPRSLFLRSEYIGEACEWCGKFIPQEY